MTAFLKEHISKLVDLTDEEYQVVAGFFKPVSIRKRQFLIQENQTVDAMYLVTHGLLKSSLIDDIGKEHILQFACEDWWASDFAAFFKQEKSTVAIDAIEDTEMLCITRENLEMLCREIPKIEHFFRVKSNLGYVALQKRILSMMTNSAKVRYEAFCNCYPHIVQRVPKQMIANYLGVSRETISRLQQ